MSKVSVSILDADILNFKKEIKRIESADLIHLDIMDGHFVDNLSFGHNILKALRNITKKYVETHLMVFNPEKFWRNFVLTGSKRIIFHIEATKDPLSLIKDLRKNNVSVGISLNPDTPVEFVEEYLGLVELVLIMSVHPGRGGQKFIKKVLYKAKKLNKIRSDKHYKFLLEIDGGINYHTGKLAVNSGIDILVAGSFIFKKGGNIKKRLENLKNL